MKRLFLLALIVVGGAMAGCDPAPSEPLAPDAKLPDTSKMSPDEIAKLRQQGSEGR